MVAIALSCVGICLAQVSIGGVVNKYVPVLKVIPCDSAVQVSSSNGFSVGDLVFIIQMKGAKVYATKDSLSGLIADLSSAGVSEFLTVGSITADMVTFTTRLANNYNPSGVVQLIRVPRYTSARVVSPLTCEPWNGAIGGVLVIDVAKDLILAANISADGMGFAGGNASNNNQTVDIPDWSSTWNEGRGGEKGEGIAAIPGFLPIACRGRWANGGGGGNGANAGGGGGSNGGRGGRGGKPLSYNKINPTVGGEPGVVLDTAASKYFRLVMGGGGGGGHQNDLLGTSGGTGGGIIILRMDRLIPQGFTISSNGTSSLPTRVGEKGDGTGGGGAGGTILLDVKNITTIATITAIGGNSGNVTAQYNAHGPGGGGGGGTVITTQPTSDLNINVSGGAPGIHTNPSNENYLGSWGAQPGKTGAVQDTFAWNTPISIGLDAWGGGPFCGTQTVELSATEGFASYLWSNGETTATIHVNVAGNYTLTAVDPSGCVHTAGPIRVWENSPQYTLDAQLDFGTVDYKRKYIRTIPLVNNDDEDIVVSRIASSQHFTVLSPITFPVVVPAGQSIPITVQLFTVDIQDYHELLEFEIVSPCPDSGTIKVDAIINLVHAHYSVPDTTAPVGVSGYGIPIRVRVSPDTLILPATHMVLTLRFDSRIFSPSILTRGVIVGDVIDVVASTRTLTIEFDSIDIIGPEMQLTTVIGTVLNSYVTKCTLDIVSVEYIDVFQTPIDEITDGSLIVSPVCFQRGRQIKAFGKATATIAPNPASDDVVARIKMDAPGLYQLVLVDVTGSAHRVYSGTKPSEGSETITVPLDLSRLSSGVYSVLFTTPFQTIGSTLVIER